MGKFKIYIHHYYTYELFWLYCHGLEIEPETVPTWFMDWNRYNKSSKVKEEVILNGVYKGNDIEIVFCNKNNWDKEDGFHLFDYSVNLLEENAVSDRGFNSNLMNVVNKKNLDFLNPKVIKLQNKIHYVYIDWEGHDPYIMEGWYKKMSPKIQFFVDETKTNSNKEVPNHHFVFTNLIWSFIYPNTLGIRDYYFFGDYLKYKNDYKYKINIPIRRLYGDKEKIADEVLKLNNPHISITHSSFNSSEQINKWKSELTEDGFDFRKKLLDSIPDENYINKRGYGIHDWGGEWNSNNMNENMWKMFGISEVCILFEHSPEHDRHTGAKERYAHVGNNYITEKSISHIMVGKPFIPFYRATIDFYDEWLKYYGKKTVEFPLEYDFILDKLDYIDQITRDEEKWKLFLEKIKLYVDNLRTQLIELIHENNSYLDYVISEKENKPLSIL